MKTLSQDDIQVTNQKDKDIQLQVLRTLDQEIALWCKAYQVTVQSC